MKRISLSVLCIGIGISFSSQSNAESVKYQYRSSGKNAYINFYSYDESGCGYTGGYMQVSESMYRDNQNGRSNPVSMGYVSLYSDNWCNSSYRYGYGEINLSALNIPKSLSNATAHGAGSITWDECSWDETSSAYSCNNKSENITVDIEITAMDSMVTNRSTNSSVSSGPWGTSTYSSRSNGTYRDANATGSISGDAGTSIDVSTSSYSQIANWISGYMSIQKYKP